MDAFKKYQTLMESKMESIIKECDVTNEQFSEALQITMEEREADIDDLTEFKFQAILSVSDYKSFIKLMKDYKSKYPKKDEA